MTACILCLFRRSMASYLSVIAELSQFSVRVHASNALTSQAIAIFTLAHSQRNIKFNIVILFSEVRCAQLRFKQPAKLSVQVKRRRFPPFIVLA